MGADGTGDGSGSFLKKRTKKLLDSGARAGPGVTLKV
jgi:hypothetical protein